MQLKAYIILIFFIITFAALPNYAQENENALYVPLNIRQAYENSTRSWDGKPGENYWINHADYTIKAELKPETRSVNGSAGIVYHNQSPDTLNQVVLRLYQDFFRQGGVRDWAIGEADLHDGVKISQIVVNDSILDLKADDPLFSRQRTNLIIDLQESLEPGRQLQMKIDWAFTISKYANVRMGSYDSTSFFVGYWYPQIAVYDDIDGWDRFYYSGMQEYYNDHNNYDVEITVPRGFIVWATGELQNPREVLSNKYLKRYQKARKSSDIIHIIEKEDLDDQSVTKQQPKLTWKFRAEKVPDFAFATSDHYLWDGTYLQLPDGKSDGVFISAAYKTESKDFYEVAEISRKTIAFFSEELPGVPFPYPEITVFNGGGGMEYPMMVNNGSTPAYYRTVHLTSHEIAHTYFPFYTGTNERKYAWMDEGWAVMLPFELQSRLAPDYDPIKKTIEEYLKYAGTEYEMPMMIPSILYGSNAYRPAYRIAAYNRSAIAYQLLKDMLGETLFVKSLKAYIHRWQEKHPIPYDFFFTFNEVTGKNLNWFWKPWFFEHGYPDLAIKDVIDFGPEKQVIIEKVGNLPVPVHLKVYYTDHVDSLHYGTEVWKTNSRGFTIKLPAAEKIIQLELGHKHIPDANRENNIIKFE